MASRKPIGRMVIWCANCKHYFTTSPETFKWMCPTCKSYTATMRCNRCGYEWRPRTGKVPKTCPGCDSYYWNRQRMLPDLKRMTERIEKEGRE